LATSLGVGVDKVVLQDVVIYGPARNVKGLLNDTQIGTDAVESIKKLVLPRF
jgi:hypothetical protein